MTPAATSAPATRAAPGPRRGPLFWAVAAGSALAWLWVVARTHAIGEPLLALALLVLGAAGFFVYTSGRSTAWRYLFPGVAGMLLFVAFPLLYTVQLGFTNYSSAHLLEEARARDYLLAQTDVDDATVHPFDLQRDGDRWRVLLTPPAGAADRATTVWRSAPLDLDAGAPTAPVALEAAPAPPTPPPLDLAERVRHRAALQALALATPDGGTVLRYAGLREFAVVRPVWRARDDGALVRVGDGAVFTPDRTRGVFADAEGRTLSPGFKVAIGFDHYRRMLFDADFRSPFLAIFVWTVAFAALTVLFSSALGIALAVLLNWEALSHRTLYRTLLFLPYAVPGFISILVWKGLFNANFGEINAILDALFGVRPAWFSDPWLARAMLLIVNTWLGYPYVMVLATGLLKAIPSDLYEASAIAGAGPLDNFFRITLPLLARPLAPLLISAFAFNFNNFVLIALLTDGRPDFLGTKLPAGTTDILVSYTYRIAFTDAGQNFGLAAAISTLIFLMVAVMALVQLRVMRRLQAQAPAR